jgi:putative oxidoreductase
MNFRNRYLLITLRTILGLFLLMSGITGFMAGPAMNGVPAPMIPSQQSLWVMGIFQMIKATEIVAGLMLILGFLPALAAIFIAPLAVGIIVYNSRIAPAYLPTGIIVVLLNAYLGYAYWDKYKALFSRT